MGIIIGLLILIGAVALLISIIRIVRALGLQVKVK